jgi:hypothetical protein
VEFVFDGLDIVGAERFVDGVGVVGSEDDDFFGGSGLCVGIDGTSASRHRI